MKNQRIECSFEGAYKRAKKHRGVFWARDVYKPNKYSWDRDGKVFVDQHGYPFKFDGSEFDMIWIYEPPKRSAFKEWIETICSSKKQSGDYLRRKEGWNAHHEAVVKLKEKVGIYSASKENHCFLVEVEEFEKLREP
jgi:hypothetical protein